MRQAIHPGIFLGGAILLCTAWLVARPPVPLATFARNAPRATAVDRPGIALDAAILERYAGKYRGRGDFTVDVTLKDGKLFAQIPGSVPFEMRAASETEFFLPRFGYDVKFDIRADGAVRGFAANTEYGVMELRRAR